MNIYRIIAIIYTGIVIIIPALLTITFGYDQSHLYILIALIFPILWYRYRKNVFSNLHENN